MLPVITPDEMRAAEAAVMAGGVAADVLIGRAADAMAASFRWESPTVIVCGRGNNGGDGYALACRLVGDAVTCRIVTCGEPKTEAARLWRDRALAAGIPTAPYAAGCLADAAVIADCLFGIGFSGIPSGIAAEVIDEINRAGVPVVSADVPSGLDAASGLGGPCVRASQTVTFGARKTGLLLNMAKDVVGRTVTAGIGIPLSVSGNGRMGLIEPEDLRECFPPRKNFSHKGDYGYVTLIGGSREYVGAVRLAEMACAALRAGCGVVRLAVPESLLSALQPHILESTLCGMPERGGCMTFDRAATERALRGVKAAAVGPGWGIGSDGGAGHREMLTYLLREQAIPLVIDADGLNVLAGMDRRLLRETRCRVLLTPHLAEFSRLSGVPVDDLRTRLIDEAKRYAADCRVTLLLKGPCTVVTDGDAVELIDRGSPGMATAGSGDVLTGVLCGLCGYSPAPMPRIAACGAWLAGRAGELAAEEIGEIGMLAGDTARQIAAAIRNITSHEA